MIGFCDPGGIIVFNNNRIASASVHPINVSSQLDFVGSVSYATRRRVLVRVLVHLKVERRVCKQKLIHQRKWRLIGAP
jgi:hypothetical protein